MKSTPNPFTETAEAADTERGLVRRARAGDREALESLISRHQAWIYNIVRRMLYHPQDAEDTTQEILIKIVTHLATFEGQSSFRTWAYRIAVNHILNLRRRAWEERVTFEWYGKALDGTPTFDVPDTNSMSPDTQLLVKEAELSCSSAMLLCLDREQRLVYILGDIFGLSDVIGGELLDVSRDNFRQKLARARRDLHSFLNNKCGLVNKANPCRCAKKAQGFVQLGHVDPKRLLFVTGHMTRVKDVAPTTCAEMEALDAAYVDIQREHPFHDSPDFVAAVRRLIDQPGFEAILKSPQQ